MRRKTFKDLLSSLSSLTHNQRKILLDELTENPVLESLKVIEARSNEQINCPHCDSSQLQRWGKSNGSQRYRCKACLKTFNSLTNSSLSKLHYKEKWLLYSQCLLEGHSIRKAAKICGIDLKTSFRWRHRFLARSTHPPSTKMTGIVEADETFFTENCKGNRQITHRKPKKRGRSSKRNSPDRIPVLLIRDRNGTAANFVFREVEKQAVHDSLRPLVDKESVLCTDGNSIYQSFAKGEGIAHKRLIGLDETKVIDEIFHIQNLNAYISRLKKWMVKFNGVATKYLDHYLGWRKIIETKNQVISGKDYLRMALL